MALGGVFAYMRPVNHKLPQQSRRQAEAEVSPDRCRAPSLQPRLQGNQKLHRAPSAWSEVSTIAVETHATGRVNCLMLSTSMQDLEASPEDGWVVGSPRHSYLPQVGHLLWCILTSPHVLPLSRPHSLLCLSSLRCWVTGAVVGPSHWHTHATQVSLYS